MSRSLPARVAFALAWLIAAPLNAQERGTTPERVGFFDRLEQLRRSLVGDDTDYEPLPDGSRRRAVAGRGPASTASRDGRHTSAPGNSSGPTARRSSRRGAAPSSTKHAPPAGRRLPSAPQRTERPAPAAEPREHESTADEFWPDEVPLANDQDSQPRPTPEESPYDEPSPQVEDGVPSTRRSEKHAARPAHAGTARPGSAAAVPKQPVRTARATPAPDLPDALAKTSPASPVIRATVKGPKKLVLGRSATYTVDVHNEGQAAALELSVTITLPEWASVERAQAPVGQNTIAVEGGLEWQINRLESGGTAQLILDLVPRERRPIELGVRWSCAAAESQLSVEVHEPRLQLSLAGPRQVEFGSKQVYTLTLINSGDGDATQVGIQLMPLSPGDPPPGIYKVGTLPAGASKAVELELIARQSGTVEIKALATSAEGLEAELSEVVEVLRPELALELSGPSHQFALAPATYQIRVRNQGNAVARNVRVSAVLPPRGEFLSSGGDAEASLQGHELVWNIPTLAPGAHKTLTLQCTLGLPGDCRVEVAAEADHGAHAAASHATRVTALADLVLDVSDPNGPVAVGETAVYELRISNRGAASAENVQVTAYFSTGLEPLAAEGTRYEISTGTVQFVPIRSLAAGQEIVLRVQARAEAAGSHKARFELTCSAPETSLVVEETTLFYANE